VALKNSSMDKKNNHYIPKCLLKRWVTNNGKYDGLNVLDLKTRTIYFSSSTGRKAYSFASYDNLYILTQNSVRQKNLENWFDGLENSLSLFIDKASLSETDLFKNLGHINKLVMGLISFEYRSRYFLEQGIQYLEENPKIKNGFNGKNSFQIILENVVNATTDKANLLFPIDLTVWKSNIPLLLCDRPLMLDKVDGYSFFPLAPNMLLSFIKAQDKSTINYQNLDDKLAISFNNMIVENGRDWIVSTDRKILDEIRLNFVNSEYNDSLKFEKFKTLLTGYEF
jgi:hypothetical protein